MLGVALGTGQRSWGMSSAVGQWGWVQDGDTGLVPWCCVWEDAAVRN